jgi:Mg2+ and Co2+ transporter CorA
LKRYQAVLEEKASLTFQLQDANAVVGRLQADLVIVSQSRDTEHERAQVLFDIVEELEEECSRIAEAAEAKQEAVSELQDALHAMEQKEESRAKDVDEMALHLGELRARLNDIQDETGKKDHVSAAAEGDMREMYQVCYRRSCQSMANMKQTSSQQCHCRSACHCLSGRCT